MEGVWDREARKELEELLIDVQKLYHGLLKKEQEQTQGDRKRNFHIQQVIRELEEQRKSFEINRYAPDRKPVCEELISKDRKKTSASVKEGEKILEFLKTHYKKLCWQYGYSDLSKALKKAFAFGEVLGAVAPILPKEIALGFVLLSPNTHYPKHVHEGVDELYFNLGAPCEINGTRVPRGKSYYVLSGLPHAIQSSSEEMTILLYTWTFSSGKPENYEMRFVE